MLLAPPTQGVPSPSRSWRRASTTNAYATGFVQNGQELRWQTTHELRLVFGGTDFYLPSTRSIPEKSNSTLDRGSLPTRSVSRDLSREITFETLATESFGSPVTRADKLTLPGARAHFRLLVSGTQTTVEIRLWLSASP